MVPLAAMADVPKIIHQFWDREKPPDDVAALIQTWRDHHPAWRHILWSDESAAAFIYNAFGRGAMGCFNACTIPAMRADVLRVAAVLVHGGLYVDADAECLGPLDAFADRQTLYIGTSNPTHSVKVKNGFFIDLPGTVLFRWAWKVILRNIAGDLFPGHVSRMTGPIMLTRVWNERLTDEERAPYRLIRGRHLASVITHRPDLRYREEGGHWPDQIGRGPIVDFSRAKALAKRGGDQRRLVEEA